jgi:hypothetical protein
VGNELGFTKHNQRFLGLKETPWEGANTMASLFELAYQTISLGQGNLLSKRQNLAKMARPLRN